MKTPKKDTKQRLFEVMGKIDSSFKPKLNENIYRSKYGHMTIDKPIISDAITLLSQNSNAVEFSDKSEFDVFLNKQPYFSASYSHCYYTEEDMEANKPADNCVLLFETGREVVAVWDDINKIGFVLPKQMNENDTTSTFQSMEQAEDYLTNNNMHAKDEGKSDIGFVRKYVGRHPEGNIALVFEDGKIIFFNGLLSANNHLDTINYKSIVN